MHATCCCNTREAERCRSSTYKYAPKLSVCPASQSQRRNPLHAGVLLRNASGTHTACGVSKSVVTVHARPFLSFIGLGHSTSQSLQDRNTKNPKKNRVLQQCASSSCSASLCHRPTGTLRQSLRNNWSVHRGTEMQAQRPVGQEALALPAANAQTACAFRCGTGRWIAGAGRARAWENNTGCAGAHLPTYTCKPERTPGNSRLLPVSHSYGRPSFSEIGATPAARHKGADVRLGLTVRSLPQTNIRPSVTKAHTPEPATELANPESCRVSSVQRCSKRPNKR